MAIYTARSESAATLALKSWPCFVTIIRTRVAIDAISHQWPGRPLAGMLGKAIRKRFCSRCCRAQLARQGAGDVPQITFRISPVRGITMWASRSKYASTESRLEPSPAPRDSVTGHWASWGPGNQYTCAGADAIPRQQRRRLLVEGGEFGASMAKNLRTLALARAASGTSVVCRRVSGAAVPRSGALGTSAAEPGEPAGGTGREEVE
jgi:hypothetical protein